MKKVVLAVTMMAALAQAGDVVHYDKGGKKKDAMSKPNHPTTGLYVK